MNAHVAGLANQAAGGRKLTSRATGLQRQEDPPVQTPRETGILAEAHHIHHGVGIMLSNEFPVNYFSVSEVEQDFPEFQVRKNQGFGQKEGF